MACAKELQQLDVGIIKNIAFYDWESDGLADHVGIVERVEDGIVYSIEGNAGDACIENSHYLATAPIYGYGTPAY